jgi:hypothetical protein
VPAAAPPRPTAAASEDTAMMDDTSPPAKTNTIKKKMEDIEKVKPSMLKAASPSKKKKKAAAAPAKKKVSPPSSNKKASNKQESSSSDEEESSASSASDRGELSSSSSEEEEEKKSKKKPAPPAKAKKAPLPVDDHDGLDLAQIRSKLTPTQVTSANNSQPYLLQTLAGGAKGEKQCAQLHKRLKEWIAVEHKRFEREKSKSQGEWLNGIHLSANDGTRLIHWVADCINDEASAKLIKWLASVQPKMSFETPLTEARYGLPNGSTPLEIAEARNNTLTIEALKNAIAKIGSSIKPAKAALKASSKQAITAAARKKLEEESESESDDDDDEKERRKKENLYHLKRAEMGIADTLPKCIKFPEDNEGATKARSAAFRYQHRVTGKLQTVVFPVAAVTKYEWETLTVEKNVGDQLDRWEKSNRVWRRLVGHEAPFRGLVSKITIITPSTSPQCRTSNCGAIHEKDSEFCAECNARREKQRQQLDAGIASSSAAAAAAHKPASSSSAAGKKRKPPTMNQLTSLTLAEMKEADKHKKQQAFDSDDEDDQQDRSAIIRYHNQNTGEVQSVVFPIKKTTAEEWNSCSVRELASATISPWEKANPDWLPTGDEGPFRGIVPKLTIIKPNPDIPLCETKGCGGQAEHGMKFCIECEEEKQQPAAHKPSSSAEEWNSCSVRELAKRITQTKPFCEECGTQGKPGEEFARVEGRELCLTCFTKHPPAFLKCLAPGCGKTIQIQAARSLYNRHGEVQIVCAECAVSKADLYFTTPKTACFLKGSECTMQGGQLDFRRGMYHGMDKDGKHVFFCLQCQLERKAGGPCKAGVVERNCITCDVFMDDTDQVTGKPTIECTNCMNAECFHCDKELKGDEKGKYPVPDEPKGMFWCESCYKLNIADAKQGGRVCSNCGSEGSSRLKGRICDSCKDEKEEESDSDDEKLVCEVCDNKFDPDVMTDGMCIECVSEREKCNDKMSKDLNEEKKKAENDKHCKDCDQDRHPLGPDDGLCPECHAKDQAHEQRLVDLNAENKKRRFSKEADDEDEDDEDDAIHRMVPVARAKAINEARKATLKSVRARPESPSAAAAPKEEDAKHVTFSPSTAKGVSETSEATAATVELEKTPADAAVVAAEQKKEGADEVMEQAAASSSSSTAAAAALPAATPMEEDVIPVTQQQQQQSTELAPTSAASAGAPLLPLLADWNEDIDDNGLWWWNNVTGVSTRVRPEQQVKKFVQKPAPPPPSPLKKGGVKRSAAAEAPAAAQEEEENNQGAKKARTDDGHSFTFSASSTPPLTQITPPPPAAAAASSSAAAPRTITAAEIRLLALQEDDD